MFCEYCGKQIDDNSKFCPYCGKTLSSTDISNFEEAAADSTKAIENKISDTENEQTQEPIINETNQSSKTLRVIFSFIIGMILSFITCVSMLHSNIFSLAIIIISWIGFVLLARIIILSLSGDNGASILGGIIIGSVATGIFTNILGSWAEFADMAKSYFGLFFRLLPVGLVWTIIIYAIASSLGNNDSKNNSAQ